MNKKILFLSKDNLTTNPRLKKEFFLAFEKGFDADFTGFSLNNWSDEIEKENVHFNAKLTYLPATKHNGFFLWLISSIIEKIAKIIYPLFKNSLIISSFAHSKRSVALFFHLLFKKEKYDIISAHTLPTLYPAYFFAKKTKTPFYFDIEDFHPGEKITGKNEKKEKARREFLMKKILPHCSFFTYASPLIGEFTLKLLSNEKKIPPHIYIPNSFPSELFSYKENNSGKIKFVWFSQNIAPGRGLELFLEAAQKYENFIEVTLIGNLYKDFYEKELKKHSGFVKILPPMSEKELYGHLSNYDIGLALEMPGIDINKDICLSNKIFAYAQAGLFILATNTKGQARFLSENPQLGIIVMPFLNDYYRKIEFIRQNLPEIRLKKRQRFNYAKKFAWENEKQKILKLWQNL